MGADKDDKVKGEPTTEEVLTGDAESDEQGADNPPAEPPPPPTDPGGGATGQGPQ